MADRVGRVFAVAEELVISSVSFDQLILLESKKKIDKRFSGNVKTPNRVLESNHDGMTRLALIATHELFFPPAQQAQGAGSSAGFVGQIVGPAAISVDVVKMLQKPARQK